MNQEASTSTNMDLVPQPARGTKRKKVDVNKQEVKGDTIKKIAPPNKPLKDICLIAISNFYFYAVEKTALKDDAFKTAVTDIDLAVTISNILFSVHNHCRQSISGTETNLKRILVSKDFKIVYQKTDYALARDETFAWWRGELAKHGLEYNKNAVQQDGWIGTMSPFISMLTGFKLRYNEIRLGHSTMPIKCSDSEITVIEVRSLGLEGAHHVLMEGSTFPPQKRSAMAQSVGPVTALICLIRSSKLYSGKWKTAVIKAFNYIGRITEIVDKLDSSGLTGNLAILGLMADIALVVSKREANRVYFPLNMFALYIRNNPSAGGSPILFDTTGRGAFFAYKHILSVSTKWRMSVSMSDLEIRQIVFHAMFGTHREDFGILSQITDNAIWSKRSDIENKFSIFVAVEINLIGFRYYSNMSTANQTGLLGAKTEQVIAMPSFSGFQKRYMGGTFREHILRKKSIAERGLTNSSIVAYLQEILNNLMEDKKGISTQNYGVMCWRYFSELTKDNHGSEAKDFIPEVTGEYFHN